MVSRAGTLLLRSKGTSVLILLCCEMTDCGKEKGPGHGMVLFSLNNGSFRDEQKYT